MLIFQTPSKRCPFKSFNGREVEIMGFGPRRRVKRAGWRSLRTFYVEVVEFPRWAWWALEDELFVEPVKP